jgi:putative membrane protein insertion efficiency factor
VAARNLGLRPGVALAHGLIRAYQVTLSGLIGRHCRHIPSCSDYTDEAIRLHGLWAGGWMGFARICRCHPWGTEGLDFVPARLPPGGAWYRPWRYGSWRSTCVEPFRCEPVPPAPQERP